MHSLFAWLPSFLEWIGVGSCLFLSLILGRRWRALWRSPASARGQDGFLTVHPSARPWLRRLHLSRPEDFLDRIGSVASGSKEVASGEWRVAREEPAEDPGFRGYVYRESEDGAEGAGESAHSPLATRHSPLATERAPSSEIVSGHPGRQVVRVVLGSEGASRCCYLKREERVSWRVRWANFLAGWGLVSLSNREAQILTGLEREGVPVPRWLAVGEDARGRAFLLLEGVEDALPLAGWLQEEPDPLRRRRLARRLGEVLARLHEAGFEHRDLYAKHVLVQPATGAIFLLDWQRARRQGSLSWPARVQDLATLHATLADILTTPGERLACVLAYLREMGGSRLQIRERFHWFARLIETRAARLLRRRHVREKRQLPLARAQAWIAVPPTATGAHQVPEAELYVTPELDREAVSPGDLEPETVRRWLGLDHPHAQPEGKGSPPQVARRWLTLPPSLALRAQKEVPSLALRAGDGPSRALRGRERPGTRRGLLIRRLGSPPGLVARLWNWLARRPQQTPEQRQAALLLRLERHAIPAPRVLVLGRRAVVPPTSSRVESLLLTEPVPDVMSLGVWLALRADAETLEAVLRQVGELLARLHEAACYFQDASTIPSRGWAVQEIEGSPPRVVLDSVEAILSLRGQSTRRARRDLRGIQNLLRQAGCRQNDLRRFLTAYHQTLACSEWQRPTAQQSAMSDPLPPFYTDHPPPPGRAARPAPPLASRVNGRKTMTTSSLESQRPPSLWRRLLHGWRRLRQRADWENLVSATLARAGIPTRERPDHWVDHIFEIAVTDRFHAKQGRSTGRWFLTAPPDEANETNPSGLVVYLKRHYQLPWWQGWLATFWPRADQSAAFQEWDHLEWARRQGVPVPAPVAAGEFLRPWGRLQSFLAVEELTDMLPLNEAIPQAAGRLSPDEFRRWKRGLVAEMARLARLLHDRRRFHKDLYLCHFYIHQCDLAGIPAEGWRGRVWMIDLHRLGHHPWTWRMWQWKDLAQLLYSSEIPGINTRDQVLFWRYYRGLGPRTRADRWLRRCVLFKWHRYRQHNLRRKARLRNEMAQGATRERTKNTHTPAG
jgi:heptose I phosphotransferase